MNTSERAFKLGTILRYAVLYGVWTDADQMSGERGIIYYKIGIENGKVLYPSEVKKNIHLP